MRTAVYAGTFDPITLGHLDIATRGSKLFDKLIIAVAVDNYKDTLFIAPERVILVEDSVRHLANVEVESFSGLLVEYCMEKKACAIIRGLRAVSDFEKEFQMALMNQKLCPEIETVFLMAATEYLYISSSMIKNACALGGNIEDMVPKAAEEALRRKFTREG